MNSNFCLKCKKPLSVRYEDEEESRSEQKTKRSQSGEREKYCLKCSEELDRFVSVPDYFGSGGCGPFGSSFLAKRASGGFLAPKISVTQKKMAKVETELGFFGQSWIRRTGHQLPQGLLAQISYMMSQLFRFQEETAMKEPPGQNSNNLDPNSRRKEVLPLKKIDEEKNQLALRPALSVIVYLTLLNSPEFCSFSSLLQNVMHCFSPNSPSQPSHFLKNLGIIRKISYFDELYLKGKSMRVALKRENTRKTVFTLFEKELSSFEFFSQNASHIDSLLKNEKMDFEHWICIISLKTGMDEKKMIKRMQESRIQISETKYKKAEKQLFEVFWNLVQGKVEDSMVRALIKTPRWSKKISKNKLKLVFDCFDLYILRKTLPRISHTFFTN